MPLRPCEAITIRSQPCLRAAASADFIGDRGGQNAPASSVGLSSLPNSPFAAYLMKVEGASDIPVAGKAALAGDNRSSIKQAEHTYGLMMHMSSSLGVNCTYCHNSRAFGEWAGGPPQRATAWYGIRMARDLNNDYLVPLTSTFPAHRLGTGGDVAKINCATCHQGAYKPVYGAQMAKDYPALQGGAAKAHDPSTAALIDRLKA